MAPTDSHNLMVLVIQFSWHIYSLNFLSAYFLHAFRLYTTTNGRKATVWYFPGLHLLPIQNIDLICLFCLLRIQAVKMTKLYILPGSMCPIKRRWLKSFNHMSNVCVLWIYFACINQKYFKHHETGKHKRVKAANWNHTGTLMELPWPWGIYLWFCTCGVQATVGKTSGSTHDQIQ